jgi:hypothetical protein
MQRRNLKDEECFVRVIWRTKIMSLGWGNLCIHGKIPKIIKFCVTSNYRRNAEKIINLLLWVRL